MAKVYGNVNPSDSYGEQVYLDYSTSETGSTYTIAVKAGIKATTKAISISSSGGYLGPDSVYIAVYKGDFVGSDEKTTYDSNSANYSLAKGSERQHITKTFTITKSKEGTQSIKISALSEISWLAGFIIVEPTAESKSLRSVNFTVPQKASYTISFNANGGTGTAPSTITKWDSEAITLPANTFTRTGYDFVGWSTDASGSVIYPAGSSYNGNANTTLYAVWKSNYVAPTIFNLVAYRSDALGYEDDEGLYAKIQCNFTEPERDYAAYSNYTIKVGVKQQSASTFTYTTVTGSSGVVSVVIPGIAAEYSYDVIVVIEPTDYAAVSRTSYVSVAYFVMDINAAGTAVAFFQAAEDNKDGLYVGDDIYIAIDENATGSSTVDGEIMDALRALGWDGTVSNGGVITD